MKNVMRDPGESDAKELAAKGMQRLPFPKLELLQMRDFLDPDFCAELVTMIDAKRRPSTLADHYGDDTFRTSETCDLPMDDPRTQRLDAMLASISGIDPMHGEPLQGQRYAVGQEFKPHCRPPFSP